MLKILLLAVLPLMGGGSIFSNVVGYDFTTPTPVVFENTKEFSLMRKQEETESFFVPEKIIFNDLASIVKRKSFIVIKEKDLFLIFSDPDTPEIIWKKDPNKTMGKYKKLAMAKVIKNKRLYSRKMLYR